ncbi:hypothetical protein FRC04_001435 [Tulasnella sp. 424]|nr:hypothetical protein FRC04_001435 [Tulasnella sp. 424]
MAGMANVVCLDPEVRLVYWRFDFAAYTVDSVELVPSGRKLIYKEVVEDTSGARRRGIYRTSTTAQPDLEPIKSLVKRRNYLVSE